MTSAANKEQGKGPRQGKTEVLRILLRALCLGLGVAIPFAIPVLAQETGVPVIVPTAPLENPGPSASSGQSVVPEGAAILAGVVVEGNQRIEPETVVSYMDLRKGDPFTVSDIDKALKNLFATGLFADVAIRREGDVLVVRVAENPIINRIAFEGNLRVKDDALMREVQLRPRVVFTRSRVQSDVTRILDLYRHSGRFGASVEPKIIQLEQNRVDLVFEIDEGPLTRVDRISFVGNRKFSDRTLRGEIFTRESRWYRFFSAADKYDPDQLGFDQETLRRYYLKNGYADFRIVSAVAELTPEKDAFFITITIDEGERYRIGKVDVTSKIRAIDPAPLKSEITVDEGDWYNADEVENSVQALTQAVGNFGYAFADIRPTLDRNREKGTVNITFEIQEAPRVFVERIDIGGNVRTEDRVIRREFRLVEGDAFNAAKIRRSRDRIGNLGFFKKVDLTSEPGSTPDRTVIKVDVEEQSTGSLGVGAGYSTTDGALANVTLREKNLLGKGQDISLSVQASERTQDFNFSFTEPYFLDRNLAAGIDLFHQTENNSSVSSYSSARTGGGLRLGYEINEEWSQRLRYLLRQDVVEGISPTASLAIQQQAGTTMTSLVGQDLTYDLRDNKIEPTKGFFARLSTDYAGLGGDLIYAKARLTSGVFVPVSENIVGSLVVNGAIIDGLGDPVRITDRFFLGGDNLRGFRSGGVGPRDVATGDALGGKMTYYGTLQFRFPLGLPDELGISGSLFTDFGSLTEIDETGPTIFDEPSLRASWGVGLAWKSPIGPMNLDFAWPLQQEDFDKTEVFRLRFGTRF